MSYDQDGLYHGPFRFVHPNGEPWQSGTYVHGTRHGRFSYQRCSESSPGDAKHPLGMSEEVVRMDNGAFMIAAFTWRHRGNSIYFFRLKAKDGVPVAYESPWEHP